MYILAKSQNLKKKNTVKSAHSSVPSAFNSYLTVLAVVFAEVLASTSNLFISYLAALAVVLASTSN